MKKYLLLLAFTPYILFAKNNGDSLKFEIIKKSINFLSTDKVSFKESSGNGADCKNGDYDCLIKYCKDNKLKGGKDKIDEWKKLPNASEEDLKEMNEKIIADLTTPTPKDKRTKLNGYKEYKSSLTELASLFFNVKDDDVVSSNTGNDISVNSNVNNGNKSKIPFMALLFSLIALVLSLLSYLKGKNKPKSNDEKTNHELKAIGEIDLQELKSKLTQKQDIHFNSLEKQNKEFESRIKEFENRLLALETSSEKKTSNNSNKNNAQESNVQILYAVLPDNINSFSQSVFSNNQNGEQVYEIQINGDSATYVVSSDMKAQKYALTDFNYFLSSACELINQPTKDSRINTVTKGTLVKSGSDWIIQSKAKIEFK